MGWRGGEGGSGTRPCVGGRRHHNTGGFIRKIYIYIQIYIVCDIMISVVHKSTGLYPPPTTPGYGTGGAPGTAVTPAFVIYKQPLPATSTVPVGTSPASEGALAPATSTPPTEGTLPSVPASMLEPVTSTTGADTAAKMPAGWPPAFTSTSPPPTFTSGAVPENTVGGNKRVSEEGGRGRGRGGSGNAKNER